MAADRWLDALGLTGRAAARLDDLSHGNQQRVQLAAALVHDPALLVLDEPFAGLDPFAMDSMQQLLMQVARAGATVLFSSHQLDVVEHLCEDVIVINSGRIAIEGRLDELRDAAASRYLDVTARSDLHPLLDLPGVIVVARDDGHVRLRVPSDIDPGRWLQAVGRDVVRVSYEPPTLSELFRAAVTEGREPVQPEVSHACA
jgi:ABC-2 type transport system ATP-binding protein